MSQVPPMPAKFYVEFEFKSGLKLSGHISEEVYDSLFRNNAAPSQPYDPESPLLGRNLAVLLQDQRIQTYSVI